MQASDQIATRLIREYEGVISKSKRICRDAEISQNDDYLEFVTTEEGEFLEDVIGSIFIILQTKIRRVAALAKDLGECIKDQKGVDIPFLLKDKDIKLIGKPYANTDMTFCYCVWEAANYYKHRDEWSDETWYSDDELFEKYGSMKNVPYNVKKSRITRQNVEKLGVRNYSTGNMRNMYKAMGVSDYEDCKILIDEITIWSKEVYVTVRGELEKVARIHPDFR